MNQFQVELDRTIERFRDVDRRLLARPLNSWDFELFTLVKSDWMTLELDYRRRSPIIRSDMFYKLYSSSGEIDARIYSTIDSRTFSLNEGDGVFKWISSWLDELKHESEVMEGLGFVQRDFSCYVFNDLEIYRAMTNELNVFIRVGRKGQYRHPYPNETGIVSAVADYIGKCSDTKMMSELSSEMRDIVIGGAV